MSLLAEVTNHPLDPSYEEAARRRSQGTSHRLSWVGKSIAFVLTVALGLGLVWAARSLRAPSSDSVSPRDALIQQIDERNKDNATKREDVAGLTSEIQQLQEASLSDAGTTLAAQVTEIGAENGTVPVTGEGLKVVLKDAAANQADPGSADPEGFVKDSDLQVVVNALWASGAEAISINGERLTSQSTIRTAGNTIQVNVAEVSSPYTVSAVGNSADLEMGFVKGSGGRRLASLRDNFGISVSWSQEKKLDLPATSLPAFHYVLSDSDPAPSPSKEPTP